jgi:2-polyprenyl-3-methyl-5-hydroxy-6-metoxy-1,4-benzoquinol methylase
MYGDNYGYRSGLNASMVAHLARIARRLEVRANLIPGQTVLDIGANDGTLLRSYSVTGLKKIGIDPTIAKFSEFYEAEKATNPVTTVPDFFKHRHFNRHVL